MIKNIKLFINKNDKSIKTAKLIKEKFINNGFIINDNNYDLAIAIGGDGSFLRMIKSTNFNSNIYYVGINSGTLGFLQEIKIDEIDKFILELKNIKYKIEEIGIQETIINNNPSIYSLNEIIIRNKDLKTVTLDISIDNDLLERFIGDGILVATSTGSTAHNLSLGGSIVYNTFTSLQITPIAPINTKVYRSLINSVIIPDKKEITIIPTNNKELLISIDGENNYYENVDSPYNTYKYAGLPVGPICNPGLAAIQAVLKPEEHNYYYYHTDTSKDDGSHIFSETYGGHLSTM